MMELPIIGVSTAIETIRSQIREIAEKGICAVIKGESGVGKEVVAQNLYHCSPRRGGPFIKVKFPEFSQCVSESKLFDNCPAGSDDNNDHASGSLQHADKGVYFFDEIGDMPCVIQGKLLHALQKARQDTTASPAVNDGLWIIAATRCDLEDKVKCGDFEEELYSRLNIVDISISPLRQRIEDIPPLIDYFLTLYTPHITHRHMLTPGEHVVEKLMEYHWPGNVWELQNVVKTFLSTGDWDDIIENLPCKV